MVKRIVNAVFIVLVMIFLSAGLIKTVFFPNDINELENRKANKFPAFSSEKFLDGSYQTSIRDALSDQVFFAEDMKKFYNTVDSFFVKLSVSTVTSAEAFKEVAQYITVDNMNLYGENYDHILYNPTVFEWVKNDLDANIAEYNKVISSIRNTDIYLYYIEKETDINFVTGEKSQIYEYLCNNIKLPASRTERFEMTDFEEFSRCFYRTDHHWNEEGSYLGYLELLDFLGIADEPIARGEKVLLSKTFAGSKTQSPGVSSFRESFYAYKYNCPAMLTVENGVAVENYGKQDEYFAGNGELPPITYGNFYGGDMGEIIFDTGDLSKENILILGESYDNAVLRLLASHFHKTYSVDLRYYSAYMGKAFNITDYMKKHDIDKVLLIGNIDFFINKEFVPEF